MGLHTRAWPDRGTFADRLCAGPGRTETGVPARQDWAWQNGPTPQHRPRWLRGRVVRCGQWRITSDRRTFLRTGATALPPPAGPTGAAPGGLRSHEKSPVTRATRWRQQLLACTRGSGGEAGRTGPAVVRASARLPSVRRIEATTCAAQRVRSERISGRVCMCTYVCVVYDTCLCGLCTVASP